MDVNSKLGAISEANTTFPPKICAQFDNGAISGLINQQEIIILVREAWNSLRAICKENKLATANILGSIYLKHHLNKPKMI